MHKYLIRTETHGMQSREVTVNKLSRLFLPCSLVRQVVLVLAVKTLCGVTQPLIPPLFRPSPSLSFPNPTPGLVPASDLALIPNMHRRPTLPPQSRCRSENKVEGAHGTSAEYFRHVPSNTCVSLLIWNMRFGDLFNSHVHTALKYSILTRREAVPREAVTLKFSLVPTPHSSRNSSKSKL